MTSSVGSTTGETSLNDVQGAVKFAESNFYSPENLAKLTRISGAAIATAAQMRAYINRINPAAPDLAELFISEGAIENIRGDIAFAQSCLETGNFRFDRGTAVTLLQNNFGGIGVTSLGMTGNSFATAQIGIRAQIHHLKAYANNEPLVNPNESPRFHFVPRGVAPYVEWLGIQENPMGRGWAAGEGYGDKILRILHAIIATDAEPVSVKNAPQSEPIEVRFNTVDELPAWGRPTIQKLIDRGLLHGSSSGLDLSMDMVRLFVIWDRGGVYG